jgi:hypothetical protein
MLSTADTSSPVRTSRDLVPDFAQTPSVPGVTVGQSAILALMHTVAAAVTVQILTTLLHPQSRQGNTQRP